MATILYEPSLQVDNKREFLVDNKHNDKGELSELQHTDMIETDNHEAVLIQEQQNQAIGDQEIFSPDGSLPESSTSSEQDFLPVQLYSVPLFEHKQLNYAHGQGNKAVETIELMKAADEDEHKDHMQITDLEEQCADVETQIDQIAKNCNLKMQCNDENERFKENDQANSCNEKATSENSPCSLAASAIRNASIDDQHSAEVVQVIKETNATDVTPGGEQSLEAEHSPIRFVEKQSFERNYQGTGLEEDKETSETLAVNIEVVEKDLEARSREAEDEVAESVCIDKEEDDGYDNDIDKEDVADDISEGAGNSSEQSNIEKLWPANSNQEFLLELKEKKVKEGMKIEDDETCCISKSTQNEFDITSCQQSNDGKDDSAVNVTERYRTKLMNLDDVAAITRGRRVLLGGLLALICYLCLKAFSLPALADSRF
ncbi:uncharacterized protein [Nicotiana tomentosiformis]|uniref:uncharacterized protein n=1 Tax=Nicotiana tomentosiformis TaxID=4098 RepID=UPI00051B1E41|nr:uncharacterized protein LOC104105199 [Nicotiana tomentosiformis]